jgi:hypothetical protein
MAAFNATSVPERTWKPRNASPAAVVDVGGALHEDARELAVQAPDQVTPGLHHQ